MMKKLAKFGLIISIIAILIGTQTMLVALADASAGEPTTPTTTPPQASKIEGTNCWDPNELQLSVILEEGFESISDQKGNPFSEGEEQVKSCYRVTQCFFEPVKNPSKSGEQIQVPNCHAEYKQSCKYKAENYTDFYKLENDTKEHYFCEKIQVLLTKKGGPGLLYIYIATIYRWAASLIGIITVLLIIGNGILISASAGDSQALTDAKNRIVQSLAALTILFLASLILYSINPNFFTI